MVEAFLRVGVWRMRGVFERVGRTLRRRESLGSFGRGGGLKGGLQRGRFALGGRRGRLARWKVWTWGEARWMSGSSEWDQ